LDSSERLGSRTRFVLVPGACHGGWWYDPLVTALGEHGHDASAMTLSGLGLEEGANPTATLEDHVEEVVAALVEARHEADSVVLVGHSYGGSVITGAADRAPGAVDALVYLDAFVPEDGDSCFSMTNDEQRHWYINGAGPTGLTVETLPFFDPRARPQPIGTFLQKSRLTGAWRQIAVKHYVAAMDWTTESPFASTTARLKSEPGWVVHEWETRHNVLHDGPSRVLGLLLDLDASLR
jgi:pimeloyl-ACP methyl ester carboxylesterase